MQQRMLNRAHGFSFSKADTTADKANPTLA